MSIQQVEIVKPAQSIAETFGELIASLIWLGIRVLIVWWAVAVWFPQYGITYWQLVLPVYALRALILPKPQIKHLHK